MNHLFIDSIKRIALTAADRFPELNGYTLKSSEAEVVVVMKYSAAGKIEDDDMAAWFSNNTETA